MSTHANYGPKEHRWLFMLLVTSLVMNLVQHSRLRTLADAEAGSPIVGSVITDLVVKDRDGRDVRHEFGARGKQTVLYYFSATCGWCDRNWKSVEQLRAQISTQWRFVPVLATGTPKQHAGRLPSGLPVYWGWNDADALRHWLGATPHTLVVGRDGKVLRSWLGAYRGAVLRELEDFFAVRLPPLS
jgi:hypothetical protein